MKSVWRWEGAAWMVTILLLASAVWVWVDPSTDSRERLAPRFELPPRVAITDRGALVATKAILDEHNPFRVDRSHPVARWGSAPRDISDLLDDAPAVPRPSLELGGVLASPPWLVLIEGMPGREEGVLMQKNDEVDGIRFVEVRGDTVVLASADTTWRLIPKKVWR